MERKSGVATIAVVLAAVLGLSYFPRKEGGSDLGASSSRDSAVKHGATSPRPNTMEECAAIASRLERFDVPLPSFCCNPSSSCNPSKSETAETRSPAKLDLAIALVPNPVETHLSLIFDREIEAIQQAAQDEDYVYDSSWFPWSDQQNSYESLADDKQAEKEKRDKARQPGVLVFRRSLSEATSEGPYHRGLVVFVVAEQPTNGINDKQFEKALEWMEAVQPQYLKEKLRILGPTFSGSLPSLALALSKGALKNHPVGSLIYSGSVSSEGNVKAFKAFLERANKELRPLRSASEPGANVFRTFTEGDSLIVDRFLCYLQQVGYDLGRVAILSEDETAFGKSSGPAPPKIGATSSTPSPCSGFTGKSPSGPTVRLYYPRDIASLRSEYEKQSIFSARKQANGNVPFTALRGNLSEQASSDRDSVRTYSGQLTPLAQEAVLFGITNVLERKRIEFVIVRSSNSLDQLFLSEFLRRSYPGARIVLDGSDLLFRKGMEGASLRGVMVLSTYPLLSWTQDALPLIRGLKKTGSYRVFPQDAAEGTYIAARQLFTLEKAAAKDFVVPLWDYSAPDAARYHACKNDGTILTEIKTRDGQRPATWVSVVGHRQFWVVAILNSNTQQGNEPILRERSSAAPSKDRSLLEPEEDPKRDENLTRTTSTGSSRSASVSVPGELSALLFVCLALAFSHLVLCTTASVFGSPRARAYFAPIPRAQHAILIFLGSLIIGILGATIAFSSGVTVDFYRSVFSPLSSQILDSESHKLVVRASLAIVLCGFIGCWLNTSIPAIDGTALSKKHQPGLLHKAVRQPLIRLAGVVRRAVRLKSLLVALGWLATLVAIVFLRHQLLTAHLTEANQLPTYRRNIFFRNGTSGLLPQVLLTLGMYAWFWFTLRGLALFGPDRPRLPRLLELPSRGGKGKSESVERTEVDSHQNAGQGIEDVAVPLTRSYGLLLLAILIVVFKALTISLGEPAVRTLTDLRFGELIFGCLVVCVSVIVADTLQLVWMWLRLRTLLLTLDRARLRRALDRLGRLSWESVWKMSANVFEERHRLLSRQIESVHNLRNSLDEWDADHPEDREACPDVVKALDALETSHNSFTRWYASASATTRNPNGIHEMVQLQVHMTQAAERVLTDIILPHWKKEKKSLLVAGEDHEQKHDCPWPVVLYGPKGSHGAAVPEHILAAEEFAVLPFVGFIQNILGRFRSVAMGILALFVAATLALSSYPFDPMPIIGAIFLVVFVVAGSGIAIVFAGLHRDATMSRLTSTNPGELGMEFWVKIVAFGVGPLIGLLTTLFPSMMEFIISFLQPGAQAMR